ncbi:thermonuclease family protein [Ensifer soli]|uniref:thermonuclease family protein n=1 Tax=Ciceribacter sp. sgz301302 TaxID=3342379 RepID=UPI0035BA62F2
MAGKKRKTRGGRRAAPRKVARRSSGMAGWIVVALLGLGGYVAYHEGGAERAAVLVTRLDLSRPAGLAAPSPEDDRSRAAPMPDTVAFPTAAIRPEKAVPMPGDRPAVPSDTPMPGALQGMPLQASVPPVARQGAGDTWYYCALRRDHCVIDGDTFILGGETVRIADIDAPETKQAKCESERIRGSAARERLRELLNAGPVTLRPLAGRDEDKYGRKLRIVLRNDRSLGEQLVAEGLARRWTGARQPWCGGVADRPAAAPAG